MKQTSPGIDAAALTELWSPRVVAAFDDNYVKVAENACHVMLVERKSTLHTGTEVNARTRSIEDQLRAIRK